jgi:hypothetical protein
VGRTIANLPTPNPHFVAKTPEVGARYTTVLVDHAPRTSGRSKFRFRRLAGDAFALFIGFSWRPLNAIYLAAMLAAGAALVVAILGALGVASPTALSVAGLLVSMVSVSAVAIIGRYLHRRMLDVRPRRQYYIREANFAVSEEDMIDRGVSAPRPPTRFLPQQREVHS